MLLVYSVWGTDNFYVVCPGNSDSHWISLASEIQQNATEQQPVAQSLFFFLARSVLVGRTHKEMKPKPALLKLWVKKERLLYIYLQLYLHELFHAFRCQTVTSKQSPWITCKESKNTCIKIIPDRNCNLWPFYSETVGDQSSNAFYQCFYCAVQVHY